MALKLPAADEALLREVLRKRRPDLLELLDSPEVRHLNVEQRDELRDAVSDELMLTGLQGPADAASLSPRGVVLDALISTISRA
jgi:hypothetical protein